MRLLAKNSSGKFGGLALFLIFFTSFYFPILASAASIMQIPSTPISILIRASMTLISVYLIAIYMLNDKKKLSLSIGEWSLIIFWIYYVARIQIDLWRGVQFSGYDNLYIYGFTYGNIFLPIIAILLWGKTISIINIPKIALYFFLITNLCIISVIILETKGFDPLLFMGRLHLKTTMGGKEVDILNPIAISFHGELLLLTASYHLLGKSNIPKLLLFASLILGMSILLLGASRGPFLICCIMLLILLIKKFVSSKSKIVFLLKFGSLTLFVSLILFQTIGNKFTTKDFYIFDRLTQTYKNQNQGKGEVRNVQYAHAWQDFLDSPIVGKQFVGTYDNFYPHNIFIELFMATGLIGVTIFSLYFIPFLRKLLRFYLSNFRSPYFFLILIFLPIILNNLVSGSLFMSVDLWLIGSLILTVPISEDFKRKNATHENCYSY